MSITAQTGVVGFGMQSGKNVLATTWYKHKALSVGIGADTKSEIAPPEIGGGNNPTGAYKTGASFGGGMRMLPRLEQTYGWILFGSTGYVESTAGAAGEANRHVFSQAPVANGGASFIPWMSFRKGIPGIDTNTDLGEIGQDCKIGNLQLTLPQVGPVESELNIQGRIPTLDEAPAVWLFENAAYENFDSVPVSMKGRFSLISPELNPNDPFNRDFALTGASISLVNNLTDEDRERVIGSYFAEDFATKQRILQMEITVKWKDPDLVRFVFNGDVQSPSINFEPCIKYAGLQAIVESPCPISDTITEPWSLTVDAPIVFWRQNGPVQLDGDELITQKFTGIAMEAASGNPEDYYKITLKNAAPVGYYALPVAV